MEAGWLHRARWRWRGALMWPTFVAAVIADAVIAHVWPTAGDAESLGAGLLAGMVASLLAVVLCSPPLGALLRRVRPDLPSAIARNYAGTFAVSTVSVTFLAIGLAHHGAIVRGAALLHEAVARAEAYIGFRAPAEFRANAQRTDTFVIQPGAIYRVCVPGGRDGRWYCVVVKPALPVSRSVIPAGSEPNALMAQGAG